MDGDVHDFISVQLREMAMMMKRVAKSAVQAFALGSTSLVLTRNLHVSFLLPSFWLMRKWKNYLTNSFIRQS